MPTHSLPDADRLRSALVPDDATSATTSSVLSPWRRVDVVEETGSTNADLAAAAASGDPGGRVLITGHQTAGRGRFSRRWETPRGTAIGMSVMLRTQRPAVDWGWLSLVAGMAVADGIEQATGAASGRVQLKWPNDVLIDRRKVCGILAERVEPSHGQPPAAVIGMGLNIAIDEDDLPVPTATSLRIAGLSEDADAVAIAILRRLGELFSQWERFGEVRDSYRLRCASIGRDLRVMESADSVLVGRGVDVDASGRLVVELTGGERRAFAAGDVHHLR